jgi:hypothetical protein
VELIAGLHLPSCVPSDLHRAWGTVPPDSERSPAGVNAVRSGQAPWPPSRHHDHGERPDHRRPRIRGAAPTSAA